MNKNALFIVLSILFLVPVTFGGVVLMSRVFGPLPLSITSTTTAKQSAFDVSGTTKITTVPDRAQVTVGIDIKRSSIQSAQDDANVVINRLRDKFDTLGIKKEDIKTVSYSLNPEYNYDSGSRSITGYRATIALQVQFEKFELLNTVIDTSTELGANNVSNIFFTMSAEKQKQLKTQARKEAIENAQKNAEELAALSGMKLGKIINVTEENAPQSYRMYNSAVKDAVGAAPESTTSVEPGSQDFSYTVILSYETL